jgi:hypothetical protein
MAAQSPGIAKFIVVNELPECLDPSSRSQGRMAT